MMTPRGLAGAAMLLWGIAIGAPVVGALFAVAMEAPRFARDVRRGPGERTQVIAIRFCAVAALVLLVGFVIAGRLPQALYSWLRWLPAILVPLPVVQALAGGSLSQAIVARALGIREVQAGVMPIETTHAFAATTLVGAATGNGIDPWFYWAAALLAAWALLARLHGARRIAAATALLAGAMTLGFGVHVGLAALQGQVEQASTEFFLQLFAGKADPSRERTRIGDIGRVKLGDRIVMRVVVEGTPPPEILLREAAFDRYVNGEWRSSQHRFEPVAMVGPDTWTLRGEAPTQRLVVRRSLPGGDGLLALPAGTLSISHLPASSVEMLPSGAVLVRGTSRFIAPTIAYTTRPETGTDTSDLSMPEALAPLFRRIVSDERLARSNAQETVAAIEAFFARDFAYSLALADGTDARTLADFLLRDRKGHCEYFATATTLLLRAAGVPARYTVGYAAQEYSEREGAFLVRVRHAHAWASALVGGRWITVDTTPSRWADAERDEARGFFGPVLDLFSWAADRAIAHWIDMPAWNAILAAVWVVVLAMAAIMLYRRRGAWRLFTRAAPRSRSDAAWHRLQDTMAKRGFGRAAGETPREWARRLASGIGGPPWREEFARLVESYYRLRFDPEAPAHAAEAFMQEAALFRRLVVSPRGSRRAPAPSSPRS